MMADVFEMWVRPHEWDRNAEGVVDQIDEVCSRPPKPGSHSRSELEAAMNIRRTHTIDDVVGDGGVVEIDVGM